MVNDRPFRDRNGSLSVLLSQQARFLSFLKTGMTMRRHISGESFISGKVRSGVLTWVTPSYRPTWLLHLFVCYDGRHSPSNVMIEVEGSFAAEISLVGDEFQVRGKGQHLVFSSAADG